MVDWLDVSNDTPRRSYSATAAQTVFSFPFVFFQNSDLQVFVNDVLKTITTDYTVSGALTVGGGSVTFNSGLNLGDVVVIVRLLDVSLSSHIPPSGPLDFGALNLQFSKVVAMLQQFEVAQTRSLLQPDSDVADIGRMPTKATRANLTLGFDNNGDPIAATAAGAAVSAAFAPVASSATLALARTALGLTSIGNSIATAANAAAVQSLLSLVPGTNVQAFSATLAAIVASGITTSMFAANVADTDVALAAASNTRFATQAAIKSYIDTLLANGRTRGHGFFSWNGSVVSKTGIGFNTPTRSGLGDYIVPLNFTMPDTNYAVVGSSLNNGSGSYGFPVIDSTAKTTTQFRVQFARHDVATFIDPSATYPWNFSVIR